MINLKDLVKLSREIEITDPIDWSDLNISEEAAYSMIASSMLEYYQEIKDLENRQVMLLASLVKLSVENFVLNLRILSAKK